MRKSYIGGSFIASTANSIKFADGSEFSATNPQSPSLLTINVPIGLQFGSNPGSIINQSTALAQGNLPTFPPTPPIPNNVGLAVQPGQTLALIGGDVLLNGGNLTANMGQVLLGSVASPGFVGFVPTPNGLSLNYDNIQNFGNIALSGGSLINTSGQGGGKVDIRGGNVSLNGGQIYALTLGNIDGRGIDINAQTFRAEGGAQMSTLTLGNGAAGAVNIRAIDSVEMNGIGFDLYRAFATNYLVSGSINPFDPQVLLITGTTGIGNAGNITIDTGKLLIDNGAVLASPTFGTGHAGNMTIRAKVFDLITSVINSGTLAGSRGPSFISADANAANRGGNMNISTPVLTLRDGGVMTTASLGRGDAGSITINAGRVEVMGNGGEGEFNSQIQTSVGIASRVINPNATANGGSLNLNVGQLILSNGGTLNLQALGTGQAGNINVVADAIALDNKASIDGRTTSGLGANINLQASEILLRGGSRINTDAGNANGGNITITTNTLVAVPKENSDITANAQKGSGGRISITAQGIFGTEFRDRLTPESDITATSDLGPEFNGTVQIDIRGVDPNRGLGELSENIIDPSRLIATSCPAAGGNSFTITGRGGLPPNSREVLNPTPGWIDWRVSGRRGVEKSGQAWETEEFIHHSSPMPKPLIEVTNWLIEPDGTVRLVANPVAEVSSTSYSSPNCQINHFSSR